MTQEESARRGGWDPVFLHSRREALVIFAVWLAALAWAVPFCYLRWTPFFGQPGSRIKVDSLWLICCPVLLVLGVP